MVKINEIMTNLVEKEKEIEIGGEIEAQQVSIAKLSLTGTKIMYQKTAIPSH